MKASALSGIVTDRTLTHCFWM